MASIVDGALYPDVSAPDDVSELGERIDFVARLCSAWDFGILPDVATVEQVRRPEWRDAVDRCRLDTSPTYHLLRSWHGLSAVPFLGSIPAYILDDPCLASV